MPHNMTNNIFKKSKNSFFTRKYILILVVLILFAVGSLVFVFLKPPEYNLIFYYEDYYEGQTSPFYLLDTHDFSRREITIEEINKLDLITGDISPYRLKIVFRHVPPDPIYFEEERQLPTPVGIFEFEAFLYKSFLMKGLIGTVDKPHGTIRVKGWVAR